MRLNVSLDENLVKRIDARAASLCVSRSAYLAFAISKYLESEEVMLQLPVIAQTNLEIVKQANDGKRKNDVGN